MKQKSVTEWLMDTSNLKLSNNSMIAAVAECASCGRTMIGGGTIKDEGGITTNMAGSARYYKGEIYCDICYENKRRKDTPKQKCSKCDSEYEQNVDFYNSKLNVNPNNIYKGKNLCPQCFAIQQHDDASNASKAYRAKLESEKKQSVPIKQLPESNKRRLTNKNWMDVAYKSKSKK